MSLEILSNRNKGNFPLSIGTSIALEHFFGLVKEDNNKDNILPYKKYDCVCINLSTLVRNMIASIKSAELKIVTNNDFVITLKNEITIIKQLFEEQTNNRSIVSFYYNHYQGLNKHLKYASFKIRLTDNQSIIQFLEREVPKQINPQFIEPFEDTLLMITHGRRNNLLLTHNPLDLIFNSLSNVALLESHTGKVKLPTQFNSKLKSAPEHIPFNKITLQIYGDKANQILPMSSKIRNLFSEETKKLGITQFMDSKRFIDRLKLTKLPEIKSLISRLK